MKRNSDYRPLATNQKLRAKRMGISTGQTITIHDRMQQEKPLKLVMGRCLRSMPGRRAVYEGVLHGSDVVIKVFTSAFHGWRHFRRELRGLETLANRNINTAEILTYGRYKKDWVLVLKKIENANDVHTLFTNIGTIG